jgi:Predicted membrane protein (DUF2339)
MGDFAFYALIAAVVLFGPWVLLFATRRRMRRQHEETSTQMSNLTRRVYELEASLHRAQSKRAAVEEKEQVTPAEPARKSQPASATAEFVRSYIEPAAVVTPPAPAALRSEERSSEAILEQPVVEPAVAERPTVIPPPADLPPLRFPAAIDAPEPEAEPAPSLAQAQSSGLFDSVKEGFNLEEALGANWLNKIGIVILVFGVAFFLAYQLRQVGPAGKVLVGTLVSAAMLGAGIFFERKPSYKLIGRAGIGGGWALAFFVAYATYHVPAARIFLSQAPSLFFMLAIAAGMVLHTLRYRSQVVTGLAFLLAFSTLTISQVTVYSLLAGAILAVGLVVIVGRMQWFEMEIFGIAAAYLNHWWWLRRIIEPMGAHKHAFREFYASAAILLFYWAIFRASYILRRCDERQEKISIIAALLNSVGLLALLKYQSVHPEWAFRALLAMGTIELVLGILPVTRRRRAAFLILATIGVTLLVAAMPFHFTGGRLDAMWLLESETLLLAGIFVREIHFRRLGMVTAVLAPIYLLSGDAGWLAGFRWQGVPDARDIHLAILCLVAACVFFVNSHIVVCRWPTLFEHAFDSTVMHRFSFVGAFLLFVGAWAAFPLQLTAVAWAVVGLLLLSLGHYLKLEQLPFEAHFFFACALVATLFTNMPGDATWGHVSQRLVTVSIIAALFYIGSIWCRTGFSADSRMAAALPAAYRWSASTLLLLLAYYALLPISVAPAWVVLGLVLAEIGFMRQLADLRAQGYLALACAFVGIFFVNLNADTVVSGISMRLLTVAPVALAMYYEYFRLVSASQEYRLEKRFHLAALAAWCGTITVAALLRFEISSDWVAAAWALLAFGVIATAWRSGRELFLAQALVLALAATFRGALHNLYERSYLPGPFWHSRTVCTSITAALLFATLVFAFPLRRRMQASDSSGRFRALLLHPEQMLFFLPLGLIAALLAVTLRRGLITVGWSALGVVVFLFALWVRERSFRLAGLGLLLLAVGKIVVVDVWDLSPRDRYLTFITLGSALLLVSFLYSRYREAIWRYL